MPRLAFTSIETSPRMIGASNAPTIRAATSSASLNVGAPPDPSRPFRENAQRLADRAREDHRGEYRHDQDDGRQREDLQLEVAERLARLFEVTRQQRVHPRAVAGLQRLEQRRVSRV